jgi:hypothetical protein
MSIVGPRPLLMQYLDRYTPEQARRREVKPGNHPGEMASRFHWAGRLGTGEWAELKY